MTMMTPERFIRALKKTPALLDVLTDGVTQERAQRARDGEDGWNVVEIMCHLRDFEEIFFERTRLIVEQDVPELEWHDEKKLAVERGYARQDFAAAYDAFIETRQRFIAWLEARAEADWGRKGIHPEVGEYTLLEQAMQVPLHDVDHLEQIARCLELTSERPKAVATVSLGVSVDTFDFE